MRHFPIFIDTRDQRIVVIGGGEVALAKLRLIARTAARIDVFAPAPAQAVRGLAGEGRIRLYRRDAEWADLRGAALVYAATGDAETDLRSAALAREAGIPVNVVDDLAASDFITPAIVDRDPVTVAIGTEGTAPVLARLLKAEIEALLPAALGALARAAGAFRARAEALPHGAARRDFWTAFFLGGRGADPEGLLAAHLARHGAPARVDFLLVANADPDLLTVAARRVLDGADVVVHDSGISRAVLDLARREARFVAAPAVDGAALADLAANGRKVIRLTANRATIAMESAVVAAQGIAWAELAALGPVRMPCRDPIPADSATQPDLITEPAP